MASFPDRFYTSASAYGQYDDTQYSLPDECAPKLMFVNKMILDREQLRYPHGVDYLE